ncbi:MAG: O-antigen ligase family protein [Elusimicrobia bacterium]|nr:O-antigen ligase family protein [Elusimicrobiota bacterium]
MSRRPSPSPAATDGSSAPARWALGLAVAGSLLAVSPMQAAMYSIPKLVALSAGTLLAWAALARTGAPARRTPLDRPLLALAAVTLASFAVSSDRFLSFAGRYQMYSLGVLPLALLAAFFHAALRSGQAEEPRPLLRLCAAVAVMMGLHALLQGAGVEPIAYMPRKFPDGRAVGTLGNPAYLGACLTALFPLALGLALDREGRDRWLGRLGAAGAAAGMFASGSRGAFLGAAAGAGVYLWLSGRLRASGGRRLWAGALVLLLIAGVAATLRLRRVSASDSARLAMWGAALRAAPSAPWLGSGPDTFEAVLRRGRTDGFIRAVGPVAGQANAHNDLLQALTTTGVAGLAAYLWLAWSLAVLAWRARGDAYRAAAAGALAALFLQAKVNPIPLPGMVLAALCAAWLCPAEPGPGKPRSAALDAAVALGCAAAFVLILSLASADWSHKKAVVFTAAGRPDVALASHERAERLNPGELQYRMIHASLLHRLAASDQDPERRLARLERAVRVGRDAVLWRPGEVDSHQILGTSLILLRRAGGPDHLDEAEAELDRALALDPKFTPLIQNRIVLARERGDAARAESLSAELLRLQGLRTR